MLMDADSVILHAKCLCIYMPVCSFWFFRSGPRSKFIECKYCTLYVFKRKNRPGTKKVLMCICVNKILNKKSAILRYQISDNMNQSTESAEISEHKKS